VNSEQRSGEPFAQEDGVSSSAFPGYSILKGPLFRVIAELLPFSLGNFARF
jgi:hypothetical protein